MHSGLRRVTRSTTPDQHEPPEQVTVTNSGQVPSAGSDFSRIPLSSHRSIAAGTSEEEANRAAHRIPDRPAGRALPVDVGQALDGVRLHHDDAAAALTDAVGAQAITVGGDIYLSARAPDLASLAGRRLLTHELTHVAQQRRFGARPQFFQADERAQIAPTLDAMMAVVTSIVTASSGSDGTVDMDTMVKHAGGQPATAVLGDLRPAASAAPASYLLTYRYLFTRRSGLVDMRHLFQLMYISSFFSGGVRTPPDMAARIATQKGVEDEQTSEPMSRSGRRWRAARRSISGRPARRHRMRSSTTTARWAVTANR